MAYSTAHDERVAAQAIAKERAAIVAWLQREITQIQNHEPGNESQANVLGWVAFNIESGAHLSAEEKR